MNGNILCAFTKDNNINGKFERKELPISDNVKTYITNNNDMNINFAYTSQNCATPDNQLYVAENKVILYNGIIYNEEELKEILKKSLTSDLKTDSITEIISKLYDVFGTKFINHLNGMFNICIYDKEKNKISIYTDRFNLKPLFYVKFPNNELYISSDIYSIKHLLSEYKEINNIDFDFFSKNILLDPKVSFDNRTAFSNIKKLEPGYFIDFDLDKAPEVIQYFNMGDIPTDNSRCDKEYIHKIFEKAVKSQLETDNNRIGIALSGGLDSSLVSVLASKQTDNQIDFFSFDDTKGNFDWLTTKSESSDFASAKIVFEEKIDCSKNNRKHHIIKNNIEWSIDLIDKIVIKLGMPIYDERTLNWYNLYAIANQKELSVMLGGQGSDELWYGYYPKVWGYWFSILYHSDLNSEEISKYFDKWIDNLYLKNNLSTKTIQNKEHLVKEVTEKILNTTADDDKDKKLSVHMAKAALPFFLYTEGKIANMYDVEPRFPFLDNQVVDIAISTDSHKHLLDNQTGKDLLKNVFKTDLPESIIKRKKGPLPRLDNNEIIFNIFKDNIESIKKSVLVNEIYNLDNIEELVDNVSHPLKSEELLQVISTWRFEEVYLKNF